MNEETKKLVRKSNLEWEKFVGGKTPVPDSWSPMSLDIVMIAFIHGWMDKGWCEIAYREVEEW